MRTASRYQADPLRARIICSIEAAGLPHGQCALVKRLSKIFREPFDLPWPDAYIVTVCVYCKPALFGAAVNVLVRATPVVVPPVVITVVPRVRP